MKLMLTRRLTGLAAAALAGGLFAGAHGCARSSGEKNEAATPAPAPESPPDSPKPGAGSPEAAGGSEGAKAAADPTVPATEPAPDGGAGFSGMFITARALREKLDGGEALTLIDVRDQERYEAYRIPNAISLRPIELGRAAPSRVGQGVVITEGHGADGIAERIAELRTEGLDLQVLHGGMQAWCRLGGATSLPCRGADRMEPAELARVVDDADRLVIVALQAADAKLAEHTQKAEALLPQARVVTWSSPGELVQAVQEALAAGDASQVSIIDADGTTYDSLREPLQKAVDAHMFFVDVGLRGLDSFDQSRKAMLSRRTIVSQGTRSSGSGSRKPAVVRAPKGCGCL